MPFHGISGRMSETIAVICMQGGHSEARTQLCYFPGPVLRGGERFAASPGQRSWEDAGWRAYSLRPWSCERQALGSQLASRAGVVVPLVCIPCIWARNLCVSYSLEMYQHPCVYAPWDSKYTIDLSIRMFWLFFTGSIVGRIWPHTCCNQRMLFDLNHRQQIVLSHACFFYMRVYYSMYVYVYMHVCVCVYIYAITKRCAYTYTQILFVPAGCAHAVTNVTDTLAFSANYVDASNIDR